MKVKYVVPKELEPHPLNLELVPEMSPQEFEALVEDVKEKGVLQPLEVQKGTNLILDGRNRWKAAVEANLESVPYREVEVSDEEVPLYILERVPTHRSLPPGVRAALAAEWVEAMKPQAEAAKDATKLVGRGIQKREFYGGAKNCTTIIQKREFYGGAKNCTTIKTGRLREEAAKKFGINHQYIQIALNLKKYAPESFELLKRGEITLQEAQGILTRARIEKEAVDRLIPELLELIDRVDLDPSVVWEICFMSREGQKWLVETIQRAGMDVAEEFARLNARDMKEVRLTVEEILTHPAVLKELEKKEKEIKKIKEELEEYREKYSKIQKFYEQLAEERKRLEERIRELEEQPTVSDVETEEYLELQERLEEMERKIEELEVEKGRLELDAESAQSAYEEVFKRYKELEAKVREQEEYIVRLKESLRKKKKRKSWVNEIKNQHKRELEKMERKLEKQREKYEELNEGVQVLTRLLTGREQVKKRKKLLNELYAIAGQLRSEDLHQQLFDAVVDPYTEKDSIFSAFSQVVEGLEGLTETFSKACEVAINFQQKGGDQEGGNEIASSKVIRIEEARTVADRRNVPEA